jgi:recombination protein RecA
MEEGANGILIATGWVIYSGLANKKRNMSAAALARLESLLRDKKLDGTLPSAAPWRQAEDRAATGIASLDAQLGGGLRRGHLSEIAGARSTGRTSILCAAMAAAASRGEIVALVDTCDRFDPVSAAAAGVDLSRLLWIRDTGDALRAVKAMNLVLQAGNFGIVALDLADVAAPALRGFPFTTWMRIARVVEGSETVALLVGSDRIARSPGGATILPGNGGRSTAVWAGASSRARVLRGLRIEARVVTGR